MLCQHAPHTSLLHGTCRACRQRISLYVHISGLVFDYATLGKPTTTATISDKSDAEIRCVSIDNSASAYDQANMLWEAMDTPELQ